MAYKEVLRVDISEVIRAMAGGHQQTADSVRDGSARETVGKYIAAAEDMGVSREGIGAH